MPKLKKLAALTAIATGMSGFSFAPITAHADDEFYEALTGGKVGFSARARYESVDQDNALEDADAFTIRSTLSYKTGVFKGFSGFVEIEDITDITDDFNSTQNGHTQYSVVADPEGTEVNQSYLQYNNFDTEFKFGRQELTYRKAPFHRYIGTVLWRQNHQSFDAFSFTNTAVEDLKVNYAYLNKRHTIFGTTQAMDSHLVNLQYTGLSFGKLEGYGYFLEFEDAPATSRETIGLRFNGGLPVSEDMKVIYTAEYADQDEYADGTMSDAQGYYLAEVGGKFKGWLAKFSYEMQEGDGTSSFRTPLGTNHAFQGWADQYLATPVQGLEDMYFTVVGKVLGAKVIGVYHDFETDTGGLDAGSELDLLVAKTFMKHYTVGVKYADFNAGDSALGKVDTNKFWVWGQIKY